MTYDEQFKPYWMKIKRNDPFDYKLRSKEEVYLQMYQLPPIMQGSVKFTGSFFDPAVKPSANRNLFNKVKLYFKFEELKLFPLQLQRFVFLLGDRHIKNASYFKLVIDQEFDQERNIAIGYDIIKQMYLEASRAPIYIEQWMSEDEINQRDSFYGGKEKADEFFKSFFLTEEYKSTEDYIKFKKYYSILTDPTISDDIKSKAKFERAKEVYKDEFDKYFETKKIIDNKLENSNDSSFIKKNDIQLE